MIPKEKQRELIVEIMKADEQSGLYDEPSRKNTAVDWLINEIDMQYPEINVRRKEWMVDKAKEMEKHQLIDAHISGYEYHEQSEKFVAGYNYFETTYEEPYEKP
jgi:hypothetical protein